MNAVTARFERHSLTSSTPDYLWRASRALSVVNAPNVKTAVDELITEFEALEDTEILSLISQPLKTDTTRKWTRYKQWKTLKPKNSKGELMHDWGEFGVLRILHPML